MPFGRRIGFSHEDADLAPRIHCSRDPPFGPVDAKLAGTPWVYFNELYVLETVRTQFRIKFSI